MKFRATFEFEAFNASLERIKMLQQKESFHVGGFEMRLTKLEQEETVTYFKEVEKPEIYATGGVIQRSGDETWDGFEGPHPVVPAWDKALDEASEPPKCTCNRSIVTTQRDVRGYHHAMTCPMYERADHPMMET